MRLRSGVRWARLVWPLVMAACGPLGNCRGGDRLGSTGSSRSSSRSFSRSSVAEALAEAVDPRLPGLPGNPALQQQLLAALSRHGPSYQPRTRHLSEDGTAKYTNRLILENSPYLLQHAHNPVNWHAWGDEPFARAAREGKPVFLSIGYSTCHWCHVMERESFEDEAMAEYINQHFVAIKVDREERPDVDALYMRAVQALTGRGGWPMTLVLTPERQPFFGGTYFAARDGDRGSGRGLWTILHELAARFATDSASVVAQAQQLTAKLAERPPGAVSEGALGPQLIDGVARRLARTYDPRFGGFGRAPKFPRPAALDLLLRYHRRTGDAAALTMVVHTLQSMADGGIYDQLGGGFHRYATDTRWLVPHFEKMLYDNAQLVPLYLSAYQLTGLPELRAVVRETLQYVRREMTAPSGAFYSATDADSLTPGGHEEEGYFFTWTQKEIRSVLSPADALLVERLYGVVAGGNFEGRSILHRAETMGSLADLGVSSEVLGARVEHSRSLLYARRLKRPAPLRDDKVITGWNGLMISAFARAALVLQDRSYSADAERAARAVLAQLRDDSGRLLRTYRAGRARHPATLEDYAFLVQGLLDLYESTAQIQWLRHALELQEILDSGFWDGNDGAYFQTAEQNTDVLVRLKPTYDGARPSGNAVAALNLLRLSALTSEERHARRAGRTLEALATGLARAPGGSPLLLAALEQSLDARLEVFIIEPSEGPTSALERVLAGVYLPNRAVVVAREGPHLSAQQALVPGLEGKRCLRGLPTAYVCERGRCELPTQDPAVFKRQLATRQPLALGHRAPLAIPAASGSAP